MNLLHDLPKPVIFAHRGASAHAPENTLPAFELAERQNADAIELDARLTADGKVVVIHDPTVDRTTNGHGFVNRMTLAAIKALDAGNHRPPYVSGITVPTLDEVFESVGRKIYINIELTNYTSPKDGLPARVAEIVRWHSMEKSVLYSSFLRSNLIQVREIQPDVPVALLCSRGILGLAARSFINRSVSPHNIHPYHTDVTPGYMEAEKRRGRRVHAWTVNDDHAIKKMMDLGVDGIFTDDPEKALQVIGRR